jgi:hypothetical protein
MRRSNENDVMVGAPFAGIRRIPAEQRTAVAVANHDYSLAFGGLQAPRRLGVDRKWQST